MYHEPVTSADPSVRAAHIAAAAVSESARRKGRSWNSIKTRATLAVAVLVATCVGLQYSLGAEMSGWGLFAFLAALVAVPTLVTFLGARKLAKEINALRDSTEAILAGDMNEVLAVDCDCEIGELADSFRAMVGRLNHSILRMNVLAFTDPVTELPNRAVVSHVLKILGAERGASAAVATMLFIDLDGFKRVNDTLGHECGDVLLHMVADRIIERGLRSRREDMDDCTTMLGELCRTAPTRPVVARFAGDEFVVLLPGEDSRARVEVVARRILDAVAEPFVVHDNELTISASMGIARVPLDSDHPQQLLSYADLAMYAAKDSGKSRFRFFDNSLRQVAIERSEIETDLRRAISNDELTLHYQPKINTRTLALEGVEALVRWEHPERGNIPPDSFIGIADQCGLMPELGDRILDLAARQARLWMEQGCAVPIAVNISTAQFERPFLVPEILSVLERHRVEPSLIEIEITESMVMSDFAGTRYRMQQLRDAGVLISIDDFGTGYSNLPQLSRLPFNQLKIDKSLVQAIGEDPKSEAIVAAIIHMAHALGYKVVAEGIEQQKQHDYLFRLGCDRAQGHLFGSAMPADQLTGWRAEAVLNHVESLQKSIEKRLSAS